MGKPTFTIKFRRRERVFEAWLRGLAIGCGV
jgi:hypothetical protein